VTPDQEKVVAIATRLAAELKRRPNGKDLWGAGVAFGRRQAFQSLQALWLGAGLALPAAHGRAGLTKAEEGRFLELWREGASRSEIATALGLGIQSVHLEVADRGLTREIGPRKERIGAETFDGTRRCQSKACGQLTKGSGPCQHCGYPGLTSAA
jgi:hypothetical protein